ncbi:MAG: hypothetical protein HY976_02405, partial [Candidatus Kerfeldbacteria bacterium]|nr:hypothetical protein [Candidatus Kerfeldbacteria bacterium]
MGPRTIIIAVLVALATGTATYLYRTPAASPPPAPPSGIENCSAAEPVYNCLSEIIESTAAESGPAAALALLEREVAGDPRFQSLCHSLTHDTGHVAWSLQQNIAMAFESAGTKGPTCASGFYHGVIEAAVEEIPKEQILVQVPTICAPFAAKPQSLDHYNCVHGLGHGLFALRQDDWRTALTDCETLSGTWEQESCASGVFMQNIVNEYEQIGHKSDFRPDDPLYPCTAVAEKWWRPCYINQSSHVLYASGDDFTQVFAACALAPESIRSVCYQSSGRDVAGRYRTEDDEIVGQCQSAAAGAKDCIIGAVRDEVYYERGPQAGRALC